MVAFPSPGAMRPTARDNAKAALRISEGFNMESKHNRLIGYLVYDAQKHITKSLEVTLKPYDITPGQWNLINQLDQAGELSQKELATITHKEQATITRYLDTLERKGLVVRNKHKTDRRSHVVSTTDKAHELIRTVLPLTAITANRLIEGIDQQDIDTFVEVLTALKQNAETISGNWRSASAPTDPVRGVKGYSERRQRNGKRRQRIEQIGHGSLLRVRRLRPRKRINQPDRVLPAEPAYRVVPLWGRTEAGGRSQDGDSFPKLPRCPQAFPLLQYAGTIS